MVVLGGRAVPYARGAPVDLIPSRREREKVKWTRDAILQTPGWRTARPVGRVQGHIQIGHHRFTQGSFIIMINQYYYH